MDSRKSIIRQTAVLLAVAATVLIGCAPRVLVRTPPPPIPFYEQPFCPGPDYIWIPGYWDYGSDGYYWVPGMWELAPRVGWMWTPGYWGWSDGVYLWHSGYWGRHIGFYGGIDYGCGYSGVGYAGGYWRENEFYYNSAVTRVNVSVVSNTYETPVLNKRAAVAVVSYNGGDGGIASTPSREELAAAQEQHIAATPLQKRHVQAASMNRDLLASQNHGQPRTELLAKQLAPRPAKANDSHPKPHAKNRHRPKKQDGQKRGDSGR